MDPETYLLLNLALAFYNVGTVWAHEVDIFRFAHGSLLIPSPFMSSSRFTGASFHIGSCCPSDLLWSVPSA